MIHVNTIQALCGHFDAPSSLAFVLSWSFHPSPFPRPSSPSYCFLLSSPFSSFFFGSRWLSSSSSSGHVHLHLHPDHPIHDYQRRPTHILDHTTTTIVAAKKGADKNKRQGQKGSGGGGFGGASSGKGFASSSSAASSNPPGTTETSTQTSALDKNAIYHQARGSLDVAQALYFNGLVNQLKDRDPQLFEAMKRFRDAGAGPSTTTGPTHTTHSHSPPQVSGSERQQVHEKLVELTWDTVGAYLNHDATRPTGESLSGKLKTRLRVIAKACGPCFKHGLLDVGCGDAAIVSFWEKVIQDTKTQLDLQHKQDHPQKQQQQRNDASSPSPPPSKTQALKNYLGLDLSSNMIDLAAKRYPKLKFIRANFSSFDFHPRTFDTILFNGSLQFFESIPDTLRRARDLLAPDPQTSKSRIVIAHIQGGKFVCDEKQKNPMIVMNVMPSKEQIQQIAHDIALRVVPTEELLNNQQTQLQLTTSTTTQSKDHDSQLIRIQEALHESAQDFYLVVLERI